MYNAENGGYFNQMESQLEKQRWELIRDLAGRMHEEWRIARKTEDGLIESRLKKTKDAMWVQNHDGNDEVDIANTAFEDLPEDWKEENLLSAKLAVEKLEDVLNLIHDYWLNRNDEHAAPEQMTQYSRLPRKEQIKDIAILKAALKMMERFSQEER
ncbi:MAG: hypothetical protein WCL23_03145 [Candidatus Moraniibacteriota bacterium]